MPVHRIKVNSLLLPSLPLPQLNTIRSSLPDLNHLLHRLPTNRTILDLFRADNTGTHMPTIIEQGIHRLAITYLTHLSFLICDFPIRDALAPLLPLLKSPNIFIPRPLFDKDALTVFLVVDPSACVGVAI